LGPDDGSQIIYTQHEVINRLHGNGAIDRGDGLPIASLFLDPDDFPGIVEVGLLMVGEGIGDLAPAAGKDLVVAAGFFDSDISPKSLMAG
jgi:hypothetical protein